MVRFTPQKMIKLIVIYIVNIKWIAEIFHLPLGINKISTFLSAFLILWVFPGIIMEIKRKNWMKLWLGIYLIDIFCGWLYNGFEFIFVLWNITNTFLFFFFFIACCVCLKKKDVIDILEILCAFQILNCILNIYQYVCLGARNDYLGGLFGTTRDCNGYTFIYGVIISGYILSLYYAKEENRRLIFTIASIMIMAAYADIIGLLLTITLCIVITIISMKMSIRKVMMVICGGGIVIVGIMAFKSDYSERFQYFMNFNNLLKYIGFGTNSSGGIYGVSRVNPFSQINKHFFKNDIFLHLFGYGFGNCAFSSGQKILQSEIYLKNPSFSYYWFSHAYTYMETGVLGIVSYVLFFVNNFIYSFKLKRNKGMSKWGLFGMIITVSAVILFIISH